MEKKKTKTPTKEVQAQEVPKEEVKTPKEAVTQVPKAVTATQTSSQTVAPEVAKTKVKAPKNFTAYLQAEAVYDEAAAVDILRMKLRGYKEINAGFLAHTELPDAFAVKREYLPVYRQKALVDYAWSIKNRGENTTHSERREVACSQHNAPAFFKADVFPTDLKTTTLNAPKKGEELYPCKGEKFAKCVKALRKEAKAFAPQRSSDMKLHDSAYEIVYVPVLKAVCTYEDKQYVGYVNLLNGECDMQYRVSDKLLAKADKALEKVKGAKRLIVFAFLYTLTFIGLGWYYANLSGTVDKAFIMLMGMTCAIVVPVLSYVFSCSYKRNKLIVKTVQTGKMPKAIGAKVLALVCLLVAIAEMLCFALYVL